MCWGVREIYHLCGHNIETLLGIRCSAGYDETTGCKKYGFDLFETIRRSRPDICPECTSECYRQLQETCEALAEPINESITLLTKAAASNKDSHERVNRLYRNRLVSSRAIIENSDADWSAKHMAFQVVATAREMMQPLLEIYARTAVLLAQDLERKEAQLLIIQQHYLAELAFFREDHRIDGHEETYHEFLSDQYQRVNTL